MNNMISKELLSEILGFEVSGFCLALNETFIEVYDDSRDERISIYELAFECKKWAFLKWYDIETSINSLGLDENGNPIYVGYAFLSSMKDKEHIIDRNKYIKEFEANSEPEAVFKACEWILENQNKGYK